jgi:hypothetical protein
MASGDYRYSIRTKRFHMPGISDLYILLDPDIACHRLLVDSIDSALRVINEFTYYDLVFNAISDPDMKKPLRNASIICEHFDKPIINPPDKILKLNRFSLHKELFKKGKVIAAKSIYLEPDKASTVEIIDCLDENRLTPPVIIRAAGFQGGQQMRLMEDMDIEKYTKDLYLGNGLYIIEFIDVSFLDERALDIPLYPKYRAMYVNGELIPIHLFISNQYEVHLKTSRPLLEKYPWFHDIEKSYLNDPDSHFTKGQWQHLHNVLHSLGLDYVGVDFAPSSRPDDQGKLVIFECNPSMLNWLTTLPEGDRVQQKWKEVTLAAHYCFCKKANIEPWEFVIKKGKE